MIKYIITWIILISMGGLTQIGYISKSNDLGAFPVNFYTGITNQETYTIKRICTYNPTGSDQTVNLYDNTDLIGKIRAGTGYQIYNDLYYGFNHSVNIEGTITMKACISGIIEKDTGLYILDTLTKYLDDYLTLILIFITTLIILLYTFKTGYKSFIILRLNRNK